MMMNRIHKATFLLSLPLNAFLVYLYWIYAPLVLAQEEEAVEIKLFEDYTSKIMRGNYTVTFNYTFTSPEEEEIIFENGKIIFENGTVLLS